MTPEKQRIAIAEACGWRLLRWQDRKGRECSGWKDPKGRQCTDSSTIPDYLSDLNAMHEAETLIIGPALWHRYGRTLISVVFPGSEHVQDMSSFYAIIHATAAQRAEAFLRTIGKWEEN